MNKSHGLPIIYSSGKFHSNKVSKLSKLQANYRSN